MVNFGRVSADKFGGPKFKMGTAPIKGGGAPIEQPTYLPTVASSPVLVLSTARLVEAYSGPAVRVQRVSDDAEQDIAFGSKFMDAAAAATFRGASALGAKTWYDQSGGGFHHAQATKLNQPGLYAEGLYGAIPTISFDSNRLPTVTSKRMSNSFGPTIDKGNATVFVVAAPNFSFSSEVFVSLPDTSNSLALYTRDNNVGLVGNSTTVFNSSGTVRLIPPVQPNVMAFKSGANKSFRLNGAKFDISGAATAGSITGSSVGGNATFNVGFDGRFDAMAVVVYPTHLSDADCALVEAALLANFPVVTNQSAKIVFDGDSRTEGYGATKNRPWVKRLVSGLSQPAYITNMGVAGQTLATMAANVALRVAGQYDASREKNIVVLAGAGINDITAGRTDTQVQADFITYMNGLNANQLVVCATIPKHNDHNATQDGYRTAFNSWLSANWATYADRFIDLAAAPEFATYPSSYWYDGVHFTDLGHAVWEANFLPVINELLTPPDEMSMMVSGQSLDGDGSFSGEEIIVSGQEVQ